MNLKHTINLIGNMGFRYTAFRLFHEIKVRSGVMKYLFPADPQQVDIGITLAKWRENTPVFFFNGKESLNLTKNKNEQLKKTFENITEQRYKFFSSLDFELEKDKWIVNPVTKHEYDLIHWSKIQDLSKEAGDIKFVWEKARFSYLYDIVRYDYHYGKDCASLVFQEIDSFMDHNPINLGPNYKCSQEISIRTLNWTFALYYYKNSPQLTEARFNRIMYYIYWQLHHVYKNINFSRIAVRNNHAITETLCLFIGGLLFPFLPKTKKWSLKGQKWFENEIAYQIYEDGTFLQFSMNYHRVVLQLLTWGIRLAELHDIRLNPVVYERAIGSLDFLHTCQDEQSGLLPNYGPNDGALFFKLTDDDYRNYYSQINDLRAVLFGKVTRESESYAWYGLNTVNQTSIEKKALNSYPHGGYYIINDGNTKTCIKCAKYKDRPTHSDNLHIDIWDEGENILWDTGSYKYNTEEKYERFFSECQGHNTIAVDGKNQMLKGSRFIWYYWTKKAKAALSASSSQYKFEGYFQGFPELGNTIKHKRQVRKEKGKKIWYIVDKLRNSKELAAQQYWHLNPKTLERVQIITMDTENNILEPVIEEKWCSNYYGVLEKSIRYTYEAKKGFRTKIIIT